MAFDRVQAPPEAGELPPPEAGYSREWGATYVPLEDVQHYLILSDDEARALAAWSERLIPADGPWPSAAEVGVPMYVDNCAARSPLLRSMLLRGVAFVRRQAVERYDREFPDCEGSEQDEILRALEGGPHASLFDVVLELVFEGYYRVKGVLETVEGRTGFRIRGPLQGSELEPFDEGLLKRVRELPSAFRVVDR